jgi:exopolysaccharide production protein ExoZ
MNSNIECIRAIAALAVLGCHVAALGSFDQTHLGTKFFLFGAAGVDLFFVVSGYVISVSALKLRAEVNFVKLFWLRRAGRLIPLYVVTSIVFLVLIDDSALKAEQALFQLVTHATFIHNWFPETASSINPVTWTLGIEVQLYLIAFFAVLFGVIRSTISVRRLFCLIGLGLLFSYGWRLGAVALAPPELATFWTNQTPGMFDSFLFGALVAVCNFPVKTDRTLSLSFACLALAMLSIVFFTAANQPDAFKALTLRTQLGVAFTALLLTALCWDRAVPRSSMKFFFVLLGQWSYGIYLWHLIVIMLLVGCGITGWSLAALTLLLTITLSAVSYYLLERPVQRLVRAGRKF